jgi:galactokinase
MKTLTIPESYLRLVYETREAQKAYFQASLEAKKTKQGIAYQRAKDLLSEAKRLEIQLDLTTGDHLGKINGEMTAEQALEAMRRQVDEDLFPLKSYR